jgi:hypothetical protein
MAKLGEVYRSKVERPLEFVSRLASYIGAVILFIGWVSEFFNWARGPVTHLRDNLQWVWLSIATVSIIALWIWTSRLNRHFVTRFRDNFGENLRTRWDFEGGWRIAEKGTLLVTGSDAGGLTKVGATWENYTFTFEARIKDKCLGVIVRGQDLNNYYMFQIHPDKIRPHRRVAIPLIVKDGGVVFAKEEDQDSDQIQIVNFIAAWQIFEPPTNISPPLDGWFKVELVVEGESIRIYLDDELQYQQDSFLKIPTGKVGFRNYGNESALVRNVRVVVHS